MIRPETTATALCLSCGGSGEQWVEESWFDPAAGRPVECIDCDGTGVVTTR